MITRISIDMTPKKSLENIAIDSIRDSFHITFDSLEQRDSFIAQFPKSMNVRVYNGYTWNDDKLIVNLYSAYMNINRTKNVDGSINKVTGATNEQGIKRLTRFYKAIEAELSK
jgi:hypothetical protein